MTLTPYSMIDGISWPVIPTPLGAGLMAMQYQFEQSQWLPAAELERHQLDQAAMLLRHALGRVPRYREKYGAFTVPGKLDWDTWRSLPLLERSEVQEHFERLKSTHVPPSHGNIREYAELKGAGFGILFCLH